MGSFVLQFNQDTTTTNYLKIIAFSKKVLRKDFKSQKEYELLLQKSKQFQQLWYDCENPRNLSNGLIIIKKNLCNKFDLLILWAKEKKLPRNNDNNIISKNNLQNINKPNVIVNKCQVRTCPYFGQYHQSNSMRQTAV